MFFNKDFDIVLFKNKTIVSISIYTKFKLHYEVHYIVNYVTKPSIIYKKSYLNYNIIGRNTG